MATASVIDADKQRLREDIARQIEAYLRGGGTIQTVNTAGTGSASAQAHACWPAQSGLSDGFERPA